jgi:hypothetical protein
MIWLTDETLEVPGGNAVKRGPAGRVLDDPERPEAANPWSHLPDLQVLPDVGR